MFRPLTKISNLVTLSLYNLIVLVGWQRPSETRYIHTAQWAYCWGTNLCIYGLIHSPTHRHTSHPGGGGGVQFSNKRRLDVNQKNITNNIPVLRIHRIHMFLGLPDPYPLVRGMDQDHTARISYPFLYV
jgi:hypothetical protein